MDKKHIITTAFYVINSIAFGMIINDRMTKKGSSKQSINTAIALSSIATAVVTNELENALNTNNK